MDRRDKPAESTSRERDQRNRIESIQKKWLKREEQDFFKTVSNYGVEYDPKTNTYDWAKFRQLSKLDKKTDDTFTEYYKGFIAMCKKQIGQGDDIELVVEAISEEKARRTLERIDLLSKLREDIVLLPNLREKLSICQINKDTPEWWQPGVHDELLVLGVCQHGLGNTDLNVLTDPDLPFFETKQQNKTQKSTKTEKPESKEAVKIESHEEIINLEKNEILVQLEKGEGTLKIEKVVKKDVDNENKEKVSDNEEAMETEESPDDKNSEAEPEKKVEDNCESVDKKEEVETCDKPKEEEEESEKKEVKDDKESDKVEESEEKEEEKPEVLDKEEEALNLEAEAKKSNEEACTKQAAELKAMFPDLEVIQPTFGKQATVEPDIKNVKWFREYALQVRLQHIVHCIEHSEWPVSKSFTAYSNGLGLEMDLPVHEYTSIPKRDTSTPLSVEGSEVITITTDHGIPRQTASKKRKRHIAIDVETERAKLHALLNTSHTPPPGTSLLKNNSAITVTNVSSGSGWDEDMQPPPAHQQASRPPMSYHSQKSLPVPGTSSILTPIDLSSGLTKMNSSSSSGALDLSEVHDFSKPKSTSSTTITPTISTSYNKGKLDDMLSKLMKKNNCPIEEPVIGKEKKRRKLDEIVLGLSAAKEQKSSLFIEPTIKKPTVTPSVSVLPATSISSSSNSAPSQKPFTITVTSVPSTSKSSQQNAQHSSKDSFSAFLAQAEQQSMLLKQQKMLQSMPSSSAQQRKNYEAMIADINKVADFSSKISGTYSHEAKVNKWLAEQNAVIPEQPLSADYLSASRRRRPRVDPTILDWKKITGEENVAVINKMTGKKLTGSKAPQLKRLNQWLLENPMYEVDHKWSEFVKETKSSQEAGKASASTSRPSGSGSSSSSSKKGRPGGVLDSPSSSPAVSSANLATSLPSSLQFPSLATAGLGGLNSSLLSGMSGLGGFDPKNPLLMGPFGGLPNLNALSGMSGLGNLSNMNLFANLASLGLPNLPGMEGLTGSPQDSAVPGSSGNNSSGKSKSRKNSDAHNSNKTPSSSASNPITSTSSPFPFFFPNPSLLYTPLGLGALNPFSMQPGMAAYDTLAQQCGLLNGGLGGVSSSTTTTQSTSSRPSSKASSRAGTSSAQSSPSSRHRERQQQQHLQQQQQQLQQQQLQQLLMPPDTRLLESLSRATSLEAAQAALRSVSGESSNSANKRSERKETEFSKLEKEQRKLFEQLSRGAEFMAMQDRLSKPSSKRDDRKDPATDLSKSLLAEMAASAMAASSGSSKRSREQEMKEALEHISKTSAELIARSLAAEEQARASGSQKRTRDMLLKESDYQMLVDDLPIKRLRETTIEKVPTPLPLLHDQQNTSEMDIEDLIAPSTVVKSGAAIVDQEEKLPMSAPVAPPPQLQIPEVQEPIAIPHVEDDVIKSVAPPGSESPESGAKKTVSSRRSRAKRPRSGELEPEIIPPERKRELRSSAGRAAAAAAARAAAEAKQLQLQQQQQLDNDLSSPGSQNET